MNKVTFFIPFQHTATLEYGEKVTYVSLRRLETWYTVTEESSADIYTCEEPMITPCKVKISHLAFWSKQSSFEDCRYRIADIYLYSTNRMEMYR